MTGPVVDRTVLLTLGRLPKALEVARALHAAGCRVVVAEPFRRHLTGASRQVARSVQVTSPVIDREAYLGELTALAVAEGVSLILPVSEEILHVSLLHGRMLVSAWEFGLESGKFFESSTFFLLIKTQHAISGTIAATYKVMEPQFILPSAGDGP